MWGLIINEDELEYNNIAAQLWLWFHLLGLTLSSVLGLREVLLLLSNRQTLTTQKRVSCPIHSFKGINPSIISVSTTHTPFHQPFTITSNHSLIGACNSGAVLTLMLESFTPQN
ncbi:hypothetical protein VNO77_20445 [Canavalia gladiata]|uniref:Uncharacterized protein n=1 Tax=Canavalia gladiata TaxID=3824 RepID=A0AAN9LT71_CANGL